MAKQLAFYINTSTCIGCKTCQVACQDKNNLPAEITLRRVFEYGGGDWTVQGTGHSSSNLFLYYLSVSCQHCQDPLCTSVCPTKAMHKGEQGIVSVDQKMCIGCRSCERACPYGAPHFDAAIDKMTKCNFCQDLLASREAPACVNACVTRSISFGELGELRKRYGAVNAIAPLPPARVTNPSLVITPHKHAQRPEEATGRILNLPEEI